MKKPFSQIYMNNQNNNNAMNNNNNNNYCDISTSLDEIRFKSFEKTL